MPRASNNPATRHRKNRLFHRAKGFRGGARKLLRSTKDAVRKALQHQYRDRRLRKRSFRALWITRISAAARLHDMTYSRFMGGLCKAGILIDRKMLADLAVRDDKAFAAIVEAAKKELA
jgi:large subunit ribosomal protein L20